VGYVNLVLSKLLQFLWTISYSKLRYVRLFMCHERRDNGVQQGGLQGGSVDQERSMDATNLMARPFNDLVRSLRVSCSIVGPLSSGSTQAVQN